MLIVDGHEDLAYNTLIDGRNYMQSALITRASEAGGPVPEYNGLCMLGLPEWLAGNVAVIVTTLQSVPRHEAWPGEVGYINPEGAHQVALAQLRICQDWAAAHPQVTVITHREHLDAVLASWDEPCNEDRDARQVGLVLLMENADPIREPAEVGFWHEQGLRMVGPAWVSNRYTGSTRDASPRRDQPLTNLGRELLAEMERYDIVLDLSHMSDEACLEALDIYTGPVIASHANPRRMVEMYRLLDDEVIRKLAERDGIIGLMPLNWALDPTWKEHRDKARVTLDRFVDAVDAACDLTGSVRHIAIGTDFDGGQGAECAPAEIDTAADLPYIADALDRRGYTGADIEAIMGGNWLRFLRRHLPSQPAT